MRSRVLVRVLGPGLVASVTIACGPGPRGDGDPDAPPGGNPDGPPIVTCDGGTCVTECGEEGTDLVYVLDRTNHLHSFDPRRLAAAGEGAFVDLGELDCPHSRWPIDGSDDEVTPMSMSVDREGNAWVHYTSGEIFRVPVDDLGACADTGYEPGQANMDLFGMGFVTADVDTELLYIAGGDLTSVPGGDLAVIDPTGAPPRATRLGRLTDDGEHSPELTGTGGGELWGFYPGIDEAWVQQIDRTTGAPSGPRKDIPGGLGGLGATPSVVAWAFAQWSGTFYVFATTTPGEPFPPNSTLRTIAPDGTYRIVLEELPWVIVGAGVSTCAPYVVE